MNKLNAGKRTIKCSILKTLDAITQQTDVIMLTLLSANESNNFGEVLKKVNVDFLINILFVLLI